MKYPVLLSLIVFAIYAQSFSQSQNDCKIYFDEKASILDSLKPLSSEKTKLSNAYWKEINDQQNEKNLPSAFNMAMSKVLSDSIYFKEFFKDEIDNRKRNLYQDDFLYYKENMKLSSKSLDKIKPVLLKRSEELAYTEFRYYGQPNIRYAEKEKIKAKYRPDISTTTMKGDSKGASYNLSLILQNRDKLKLTKLQIDSIVACAQKIKLLAKDGIITKEKNNRWKYERTCIINNLNEEQVNNFVIIRNKEYQLNRAKEVWEEMKKKSISAEYDSIQVINEVYSYNIEKEKIKYMYMDNPEKQKELEDYLYKNSYPAVLKHLSAEKRKNNNPQSEDKNNLQF